MKKILLTALTLVLVVGTATVVLGASSGGDSGNSPAAADISGPCDEAEHANEPRCTGNGQAGHRDDDGRGDDDDGRGHDDDGAEAGEDISGPCDEAEHATDPACAEVAPMTGTTTTTDDDNSGPSENSGPGSVDDDGDEDNSGPSENSGPGSVDDDDDDSSGPGSGDDD